MMATNETPPTRRICATCDFWNNGAAWALAYTDELKRRGVAPFGKATDEEASGPDESGLTLMEAAEMDFEDTLADCRRNPPAIDGEWPPTRGSEWCGEWQPRKRDRGGEHD